MQIGERLLGLVLVLVGLGVLLLVRLAMQHPSSLFYQPTPPPGLPPGAVVLVSPTTCLLPLIALGALGLIAVGIKRLLFPNA